MEHKYFYMLEIPKVSGYAMKNGKDYQKCFNIQSFTLPFARDEKTMAKTVSFALNMQGERHDLAVKTQEAMLKLINLVYSHKLAASDKIKVTAYLDDPDSEKEIKVWDMEFTRCNISAVSGDGDGITSNMNMTFEQVSFNWGSKKYMNTFKTSKGK